MFLARLATRIKDSVYSPVFYRSLSARPFSFSLGYFAAFVLIVSLLHTLWFWYGTAKVPALVPYLEKAGAALKADFPDDLVIKIDKGEVSVNRPEPYSLPFPAELKSSTDGTPQNILVIDTRTPASSESFRAYDTAVLLDKHDLITYRNNTSQVQSSVIASTTNLTIDKPFVASIIDKGEHFFSAWGWALVFIAGIPLWILLCIIICVLNLAYLLFGALLIWIVAKIRKYPIGYGKAYQAGLHLLTLPIALSVILTVAHIRAPMFSLTAVLIILAAINFAPEKTEPVIPLPSQTPNTPS